MSGSGAQGSSTAVRRLRKHWKTSKWVHIEFRLPCHSKAFQKARVEQRGFPAFPYGSDAQHNNNGLVNGPGEVVNVENTRLFPILKSPDVAKEK